MDEPTQAEPEQTASGPAGSKKALTFIFATVLLDVIGLGIIIPVIPGLIMELSGKGIADAVIYGGWLIVLYASMQFFFAPILGNLSDRFGRRPVLLFALLALGTDYCIMGFAPNLVWLFIGRGLAGIAGATYGPANAYIADVSAPQDRAKNFGIIGAAFGVGFVIGPSIGGILGGIDLRLPFFTAAGLCFVTALFGFFVLPETLAKEKRRDFSLKRATPIGSFKQLKTYPVIIALLFTLLLYQFAHDVNPSTWTFFVIEKFSWSQTEIGISLGFMGLLIAIVQGGLIRTIIPAIGEANSVYVGLTLTALSFLAYAFATHGWMMYALSIPFALGGIAIPALKGIMSNIVPDDAQGELQGANTSVISITAIVAPFVMTHIFGFFISEQTPLYFPGAAFALAAFASTVAVLHFAVIYRKQTSNQS